MSTHWNLGKPTGSSFPPLEVMSLYENWPKHLNTKCKPPPIDSLASLTMDMRNKLPNFYFKDITVTWLDSDGGLRVLSTFRDKRILNTLYVDGRFEKPFGEIGFRSFHLKMRLKFTPAGARFTTEPSKLTHLSQKWLTYKFGPGLIDAKAVCVQLSSPPKVVTSQRPKNPPIQAEVNYADMAAKIRSLATASTFAIVGQWNLPFFHERFESQLMSFDERFLSPPMPKTNDRTIPMVLLNDSTVKYSTKVENWIERDGGRPEKPEQWSPQGEQSEESEKLKASDDTDSCIDSLFKNAESSTAADALSIFSSAVTFLNEPRIASKTYIKQPRDGLIYHPQLDKHVLRQIDVSVRAIVTWKSSNGNPMFLNTVLRLRHTIVPCSWITLVLTDAECEDLDKKTKTTKMNVRDHYIHLELLPIKGTSIERIPTDIATLNATFPKLQHFNGLEYLTDAHNTLSLSVTLDSKPMVYMRMTAWPIYVRNREQFNNVEKMRSLAEANNFSVYLDSSALGTPRRLEDCITAFQDQFAAAVLSEPKNLKYITKTATIEHQSSELKSHHKIWNRYKLDESSVDEEDGTGSPANEPLPTSRAPYTK